MERDLISWLNSQSNSASKGLLLAPLNDGQQEDISPAEIVAHETAGELHDLRESVRELMTDSGNDGRDSESVQDNDIQPANESETLTQDNGTFSEATAPAQDITDSQPANDIPAQDDESAPQVSDITQDSHRPNYAQTPQNSYPVQDSHRPNDAQAPQASYTVQDSHTLNDAKTPQGPYPVQDSYTANDAKTPQGSYTVQDSHTLNDAQAPQASYTVQDSHTANDAQAPQNSYPVQDSHRPNDAQATQNSYPVQDSHRPNYAQATQNSYPVQDSHRPNYAQIPQASYPAQDSYTHNDAQATQNSYAVQDSYAPNASQAPQGFHAQNDDSAPQVSRTVQDSYTPNASQTTQDFYAQDDELAPNDSPESPTQDDPANQTHEWQEQATGFTLSLDEPPPELWTHINDDDDDLDYEPTDSLQGAAYVQIHGRNFTERLHHTLKHRKERAQERAEAERELNPNHSYIQKTIIICATMLMVLGFVWLSLWFIRRETPEGMNIRAQSLANDGEYEQAASMYQTAYRRYPNVLTFLAGLAENASKSGHVQTAKTAWEEYIRAIPPENSRDITHAKEQLKLLGGDITEHKHEQSQPTPPKSPENLPPVKKTETITQKQIVPENLPFKEIPLSFEFYISEGNYAYNIGMFNRATVNFFKAMEIDSNDIRPYIGLANCYYKKGMYFDSKRILDEARKKFKRNPTIEMGYKILREAK